MHIYAPYEYPEPEFYSAIERTPATDIFITMRFHTNAEGSDFILHANPDIKGILGGAPDGNLLVDLWGDDRGSDWIGLLADGWGSCGPHRRKFRRETSPQVGNPP